MNHKILTLISFLILLVAACGPAAIPPTPTPTAQPTNQPTSQPTPTAPTPTPEPSGGEVSTDPTDLLYQLSGQDRAEAEEAAAIIIEADDKRFISVFIELLRAGQIGLARHRELYEDSLERLAEQDFGGDWASWVEWYGATDYTPPPGFTTWKGKLLTLIDPRFAEFLRDEFPSNIRVEEIVWGGVSVDGIPALDQPPMMPASAADHLIPEESVFGMAINGDVRAYPLRFMDWHEMANDVIGGVPVSIAYCTLCGAAVAFDGRASDGNDYDFGSSGFLFRSNKLMYDRQTRTLWNQLTGEPVLGELVGQDVTLDILPIVLTTWEEWQTQHPDTVVIGPDTGHQRVYEPGAAYAGYFASEGTMFPVWRRDDLLATKDQIYALRLDGVPKAYPIDILTAEIVVNDQVGETNVTLVADNGVVTVTGVSLRSGPATYQSGAEVRAFARDEHTFEMGEEANTLLDENGINWQITEDALVSSDGETLPRLGGHLAYWFGWYTFFPHTEVYETLSQ